MFKWIFEYLPKKENLKVLELGCGTGLFWLANRKEIPDSWSITLSDYSEGMLETTRKNMSLIKRDFQYAIIDAEKINYPDDSFDIIIANNMLYHVEDRRTAILNISKVLKKSGLFIASTVGNNNMQELNALFYKFLERENRIFKFRANPFSLENGFDQLKLFFSKVQISRYEDVLKIDEVEPVVNYFLSFNEMKDDAVILPEKEIAAFGNFLEQTINLKNPFPVKVDMGIFICSK